MISTPVKQILTAAQHGSSADAPAGRVCFPLISTRRGFLLDVRRACMTCTWEAAQDRLPGESDRAWAHRLYSEVTCHGTAVNWQLVAQIGLLVRPMDSLSAGARCDVCRLLCVESELPVLLDSPYPGSNAMGRHCQDSNPGDPRGTSTLVTPLSIRIGYPCRSRCLSAIILRSPKRPASHCGGEGRPASPAACGARALRASLARCLSVST